MKDKYIATKDKYISMKDLVHFVENHYRYKM